MKVSRAPFFPPMASWLGWGARVLLLLVIAAALGAACNLLRSNSLSWLGEWDRYIEAQAFREHFALASAASVQAMIRDKTHLLLDARPYEDYEAGHIETALPLPVNDPSDSWGTRSILTPADALLIYCSGPECDDAIMLARKLREQGMTNITLFVGGWTEWTHFRQDNDA